MERVFKNEVRDDVTILTLSGPIGKPDPWFNPDGISAKMVEEALNDTEGDVIVRLNSGGGSVFEGVEIYNYFKSLPNRVTVEVTSLAASAASVIAMGADEIVMCTGSQMMIHEASSFVVGTKDDFLKEAEVLMKIESSIVDIYSERVGLDKDKIQAMMDDETWMTAEEAVELGFADRTQKVISEDEIDVTAKINNAVNVKIEIPDEFYQVVNEVKEELNTVKEMMNAQENEGFIFVQKNNIQKLFGGKN